MRPSESRALAIDHRPSFQLVIDMTSRFVSGDRDQWLAFMAAPTALRWECNKAFKFQVSAIDSLAD
jgi:hypothetical protein